MKSQEEIEKNWQEDWVHILLLPDGSIDVEQLKKELSDFSTMIDEVPKVYTHITGNLLSKHLYHADVVINKADEYYENLYRLRPDADEDFIDEDKVFYVKSDGTVCYYLLFYDVNVYSWMLVEFEDKTFKTPKKNNDGNAEGIFLHEIGLDKLKRVSNYKLEELK